MPTNPKGGCLFCRKAKEAVKKLNQNIKDNTILYMFFIIILLEFLSLRMQNIVSESYYQQALYPFFANVEFALFLLYLNYQSQRLRFCNRQKIIILFLMTYFLLNALFLVIPLNWGIYANLINYAFLCIILITIVATWRNSSTK